LLILYVLVIGKGCDKSLPEELTQF